MKPKEVTSDVIIGQVFTETLGGVVKVDLSPVELTRADRKQLQHARKRHVKVGMLLMC
jgi:hypothetical protein